MPSDLGGRDNVGLSLNSTGTQEDLPVGLAGGDCESRWVGNYICAEAAERKGRLWKTELKRRVLEVDSTAGVEEEGTSKQTNIPNFPIAVLNGGVIEDPGSVLLQSFSHDSSPDS